MNTPNSPIVLFSHSLESAFLALATAASLLPQVVAELQTSTAQINTSTLNLKLNLDTAEAVEKLEEIKQAAETATIDPEDLKPVVSPVASPVNATDNLLHLHNFLRNVFAVKGTKSFSAPKAAAEVENAASVQAIGGVDALIKMLENIVAHETEFSMPSADGSSLVMYTVVKAGGIIKNMFILKKVLTDTKTPSKVTAKKETVSASTPSSNAAPLAVPVSETDHDTSELVGAAYRKFGTSKFSASALVTSAQFQQALFLDPSIADQPLSTLFKNVRNKLEEVTTASQNLRVRTGDNAFRFVRVTQTDDLFKLTDGGVAR